MMARGLKGALLEMFPTIPEALAIVIVSICGFTTGIPFLTPVNFQFKLANEFFSFIVCLIN